MNAMSRPLLSFFMGCRNDSYMGESTYRLGLSLDSIARSFECAGMLGEIEIIVCDWGSETVPLHETGDLTLSPEAQAMTKFLVVPKEFADSVSGDSQWPEALIRNTSIRRCSGRYFVSTNGDIIYTPSLAMTICGIIKLHANKPDAFKRDLFLYCSRRNIPYEIASQGLTADELAEMTDDHDLVQQWELDVVPGNLLGPIGDFQLMRAERWCDMRAFDENLIYWGWMDIDLATRASQVCDLTDISTLGADLFHLEHYRGPRPAGHVSRPANEQVRNPYRANPSRPDWGFANEEFPIRKMPSTVGS